MSIANATSKWTALVAKQVKRKRYLFCQHFSLPWMVPCRFFLEGFFTAQFSYCPLIWMFHSRKLNNKINKLPERCLRIVYSDNTSPFEELLETDNSVSVHHQNIQVFATELYKIVNGLSPEIMKEVFSFNENTSYNTRNKRKFHSKAIKSVTFGSETLSHLASKIWSLFRLKLRM